MPIGGKPIKGRGAATQVANRFLKQSYAIGNPRGFVENPHGKDIAGNPFKSNQFR